MRFKWDNAQGRLFLFVFVSVFLLTTKCCSHDKEQFQHQWLLFLFFGGFHVLPSPRLHIICLHTLDGLADFLVDNRETIIALSSWYSRFSHLKGEFQGRDKESSLRQWILFSPGTPALSYRCLRGDCPCLWKLFPQPLLALPSAASSLTPAGRRGHGLCIVLSGWIQEGYYKLFSQDEASMSEDLRGHLSSWNTHSSVSHRWR